MKSFIALSLALMFLVWTTPAEPPQLGALASAQVAADLRSNLRLMCVAAHPDDEDGATLALYRKKYGVQTFAVIATRGEGGQNEIGPELYNDLAVIRTKEMMRASKVTGAELHFLNLPEFGFSKSPEEAFSVWGHEETVRRMVRVIRQTRPHVIISNHGTQKDHGHHQAVGIALQEAFDAAGDATRFPELEMEGLKPWKPASLYLRAWQPNPDAVAINIGEMDPLRGKSYAAIAADALSEHKSQGMGFFIDLYLSGKIQPAYTLVKRQTIDTNGLTALTGEVLFEHIDGLKFVDKAVPVKLPGARRLLHSLDRDSLESWVRERRNAAAAIALELQLDAAAIDSTVVPGQTVDVIATITDFGVPDAESVAVSLEPAAWFGGSASEPVVIDLAKAHKATATLEFSVPQAAALTIPEGEHVFDAHSFEPQATVVARVRVHGAKTPVELRTPMSLSIAPRVTARVLGSPLLVRRGVDKTCAFDVLLTNYAPAPAEGKLILSMAPGFTLDTGAVPFAFKTEGEQKIVTVHAAIAGNLEPRDYVLNAVIEGDERPSFGIARLLDVKVPENIRVGVVQSYDNTFINVLEKMHVPHKALTSDDFSAEKLDKYSVIIVDIRAYLVRGDLAANNQALLDYVARGGIAIVSYQKTEEWKPAYAPYPITLSRNRVTREDAPITLLAPTYPLFTVPNTIMDTDWKGWVQERGLYFPGEWDANYTPLIACNDPGETIPPGAMLVAKYGKGTYLYTALGLYRQVRELHPGALRLFANMLAMGGPER